MKPIPRTIRDVSPGEGFTRIENERTDGRPDGVHTGGCWSNGVEVWKPLDGGNAHDGPHYPTREAECLEDMVGEPGFPPLWRVEKANGRRWLVRLKAWVYGQDFPRSEAPSELGMMVETFVRALNAKGWELGDAVSLALDRVTHEWFVLDLSCAAPTYKTNSAWDDEWRVWKWWEEEGWTSLLRFRRTARHIVTSLEHHDRYEIPHSWRWVYASRHRPLSLTWAHKLRGKAILIPHQYNTKTRVHTWAVTEGPLDAETVDDYELVLGWWPWDTPARREK